jgi:molybdopterin-dependent oxidoreductase alpha subunit
MSLKPVPKTWNPSLWASPIPFGLGQQKPNNFLEVFRAGWENLDNLAYAWRILKDGVCDGCALGTQGLHDWTIDGVHLCNIRLRLLRLNTMGPIADEQLADLEALRRLSSAELRELGRIPYPLYRKQGEPGFRRISWSEALDRLEWRLRQTTPDKLGFYLTSRGIPNETYYAVQKAARALGTNHIDNAARICHSPSTVALRQSLGVGATTCSYRDLIGTDLVVFFGSNVAVNQPVMMKYLYYARKAGTRIALVNPYREPAMERYWIPSDPESALFGTQITSDFFQVRPGGDIAFVQGVLKHLIAQDWIHQTFLEKHTEGWPDLVQQLEGLAWETLEAASGQSRDQMLEMAQLLHQSERAVLVWSMGITQHSCGEDAVAAIINLALARGYLGREGCGLMPIRGHSGVQGGAEMGAYATAFPGGQPINATTAQELGQLWGFEVPQQPGLTLPQMLEGGLELLWSIGGNFLETMPQPDQVAQALQAVSLRVHQDIVLTSQMLLDGPETLILPATTRYEIPGGVSETTTERRVIFSPEIPGPRITEARPEFEVLLELACRLRPDLLQQLTFESTAAIRQEIARVVPLYSGIEKLTRAGDQFQYGGPYLCPQGVCPTPSGKAQIRPVPLPPSQQPEGSFRLVTRRGKQFNSMVHEKVDPINGLPRQAVLLHPDDARQYGFGHGDPILLTNAQGSLQGQVFLGPVARGSLQVHWPEGNVLLGSRRSPTAQIPTYKEAYVFLENPTRK